ncbi:MAG: DUF1523 family protein, partial [Pseudomonadota bacterium]
KTDVIREDVETTTADGSTVVRTRDIRQIYAATPDGDQRVFNNVDAPFYLKFDSADLTAKAEQYVDASKGTFAVIKYYGWRVQFLSWFPNAISIREAEGPDEQLSPWLNLAIVIGIFVGLGMLYRVIVIQWRRFTDPVRERWEEDYDATHGFFGRLRRRIFGDNSVE